MSNRNEKKLPSDFVEESNGVATVSLSRPAKFDGIERGTLSMREPTVADMEAFQDSKESEATREIKTFANLCDVTPSDIRALPMRDYGRLQAAFGLFTS